MKNISYGLYDWMSRNSTKIEDCKNCVYLPVCGGGCVNTSFGKTNSYHTAGCFKTRGVIERQVINYLKEKHPDLFLKKV